MIIAIDGPAGAGKSTIAKAVAERQGFQLIDTGAIYRTVAYQALDAGVNLEDGSALAELASRLDFEFVLTEGVNRISCNGAVLGDEIRVQEVSLAASVVSAHPEVRAALLDIQRNLGHARSSVLEGRDIGTVVFPDAEVKIFLTATDVERARRRVAQIEERGESADYNAILEDIRTRDRRDTERAAAPLVQADDALGIDSTKFTIDEVVDQVLAQI